MPKYTVTGSKGDITFNLPDIKQNDHFMSLAENGANPFDLAHAQLKELLVSPSYHDFVEAYPTGAIKIATRIGLLAGANAQFMELEEGELDEAMAKIWVEAQAQEFDELYCLMYQPPMDDEKPFFFILHEPSVAAIRKLEKSSETIKDHLALIKDAAVYADYERIEKLGLYRLYVSLAKGIYNRAGLAEDFELKKA